MFYNELQGVVNLIKLTQLILIQFSLDLRKDVHKSCLAILKELNFDDFLIVNKAQIQ